VELEMKCMVGWSHRKRIKKHIRDKGTTDKISFSPVKNGDTGFYIVKVTNKSFRLILY
jgi:hypothetical protein